MSLDQQTPPEGFKVYDGGMSNTGRHDGWPEIDGSLLEDARGSVPPFPLDVLPRAWARWVSDSATAAGTPPDYVAQGLFAALAAICGAGIQARVSSGWSESLVLWQALVGSPSSGKSPALAAVRRQIGQIEDDMCARDDGRRGRHAARVEQAALLTVRWKADCAEAVNAGREAPAKPGTATFEDAFVPSQLIVADATVEALADVVAGNPRGVVMWRDELSAWLANQGRYANGGGDRAHWLEAWAGAGVTINRRSRSQPLHLQRFPVSIVGTIQPDRIGEAITGSDDGMAARFLYAWPDVPAYVPLLRRPVPNDDIALVMLRRIASAVGTAAEPRYLSCDATAVWAFDKRLAEMHEEARQADGLEAGWLGKGRGTVARLAAVLTLLAWSDSPPHEPAPISIGRKAIEDAAALWADYFRPHARAVFNQAGRTDRDRFARRVVRWIRTHSAAEIARETIRRDALGFAVDADGADRVIARLEDGGLLRLIQVEGKTRGRPARRWEVNPALR